MKLFRLAPVTLLTIYSVALVGIELRTSQDHVRNYFTDISGPVRLYAINTTLTVFLLWSCALLFAVHLRLLEDPARQRKQRLFCGSQIVVFGYLGFDDRFLVHEWLSEALAVQDTLILVGIGAIEAVCLISAGELRSRSRKTLTYLALAAVAFLIISGIDAFLASELRLRLSCEDLAKAWSAFFLFLFSWRVLMEHIQGIKTEGNRQELDGWTTS